MKLWQKNPKLIKEVEEFLSGEDILFDEKLIKYDCLASMAHVKMLHKINVLDSSEKQQLLEELQNIIEMHGQGLFKIKPGEEDCHTAIENHLTRKLGEVGKKIHTARSRNDQVLTALRLFYKDELQICKKQIMELINALKNFVAKYGKIKFPGYTHTRKAMPTTVNTWAGAFEESFQDDLKLLEFAIELIDRSPLGTGAGYGVPLEIDRIYLAEQLGFAKVQTNPLYVQNSRGKFEATMLHALTQVMFDLNKLASDLIFFSLPELGYFQIPEELCTGSSIMPHKKNPDVLELIRGNYHRVVSYETELKYLTANLISGYHRDLQLTKEPVMHSLEITRQCLRMMQIVFTQLIVNKDKCERALSPELFATEEVYKLVEQGMPFREAYYQVAKKYRQG